ncbi:transposase [Streptomyces sp. H27-G5]|uniref:transposase n=1 Tax=Streptomyces sp. H27-G5 TaxID=2996698 RepID=UPI003B63C3DB
MRPGGLPPVPERTARTARAAFPGGSLPIRLRDHLAEVFDGALFLDAFPDRGAPAQSPALLALVTVLRFTDNLTDRQAADASRDRLSWKYALVRHEAPLPRAGVKGPRRWPVAAG